MSLHSPSGERLYPTKPFIDWDNKQLEDRNRNPKSYKILGGSVTPTEVLLLRVRMFGLMPTEIDQWDVINVDSAARKMHRLLEDKAAAEAQKVEVSTMVSEFYRERTLKRLTAEEDEVKGRIEAMNAGIDHIVEAAHRKYPNS